MHKLFIIALLALAGCSTGAPVVAWPREVPLDVVRQIPSRLDKLRPGMNPRQVMATLGLSAYLLGGFWSGPPHRYSYQLILRQDQDYSLTLVYDQRKDPPAFLRAFLDGDEWRQTER